MKLYYSDHPEKNMAEVTYLHILSSTIGNFWVVDLLIVLAKSR